jgi:hypothetical protein
LELRALRETTSAILIALLKVQESRAAGVNIDLAEGAATMHPLKLHRQGIAQIIANRMRESSTFEEVQQCRQGERTAVARLFARSSPATPGTLNRAITGECQGPHTAKPWFAKIAQDIAKPHGTGVAHEKVRTALPLYLFARKEVTQ